MKISIIGLSGSGKSTLARKLAARFDIPHIEIDRLWFSAGGNRKANQHWVGRQRVRQKVRREVLRLIARPNWISDGVYSRVQPTVAKQADYLVYLDIPLARRIRNHYHRVLTKQLRHPELTWQNELAYPWVLIKTYRKRHARVEKIWRMFPNKTIRLTSYQAIDNLLYDINSGKPLHELRQKYHAK